MSIGREGCDYESLVLILSENALKRASDSALRGGISRSFCVGRLAKKKLNATLSYLSYSREIHHKTVYGGNVKLKVARMEDHTDGGFDRDSARVGYRVVYVDEFCLKNSEIDNISRLYRVEIRLVARVYFIKLSLYDAEREPRSVDWNVYLSENIRNAAYMILVTVCYKNTANLFRILYKIGYIGYNEIDAEHILVGESHSRVDDYNIVPVLKHGDILSYLTKSAERHNTELSALFLCVFFSDHCFPFFLLINAERLL